MIGYKCPNCGRCYNYAEEGWYQCMNCRYPLKKAEDVKTVRNPYQPKVIGEAPNPNRTVVECPYCHSTNTKKITNTSNSGAVKKVDDIKEAYNFFSVEKAIKQKNKAPKKCAGYYFINTDINENQEIEENSTLNGSTVKRKNFSAKERLAIYRKTKGHCYLCGEFVDFDSFEVEHKVPLSKGGTNDLSNVFCACHCCNTIKHDIYPQDFLEKISQIFMYQMRIRNRNSLKWKIIHKELQKMC